MRGILCHTCGWSRRLEVRVVNGTKITPVNEAHFFHWLTDEAADHTTGFTIDGVSPDAPLLSGEEYAIGRAFRTGWEKGSAYEKARIVAAVNAL